MRDCPSCDDWSTEHEYTLFSFKKWDLALRKLMRPVTIHDIPTHSLPLTVLWTHDNGLTSQGNLGSVQRFTRSEIDVAYKLTTEYIKWGKGGIARSTFAHNPSPIIVDATTFITTTEPKALRGNAFLRARTGLATTQANSLRVQHVVLRVPKTQNTCRLKSILEVFCLTRLRG